MSEVRDYRSYAHTREIAERRKRQDAADAARHRAFDLSAQDRHMKYERAHFAVVGEGTPSANEAFRKGYESINWS